MENIAPHSPLVEAVQADVASLQTAQVQIKGMDWQVGAGDFWVIGGAHASGKSDLLATTAGLQKPAGGQFRIFGHDLYSLEEDELLKQRLRTGLVFKDGGRMFSHLTVAENVALPLRYHSLHPESEIPAKVEELLEATGLPEFAKSTTATLGANWKQRVGLARALALKPELLLLDEPLAGLEPKHRRWWLDFLGQLSAAKTTLVIATNDVAPWSDTGNQFALLRDQRWQVLGGRAELKNFNDLYDPAAEEN